MSILGQRGIITFLVGGRMAVFELTRLEFLESWGTSNAGGWSSS